MSELYNISATYEAINVWLSILSQYDSQYVKESIANFKVRQIQKKAYQKQSNLKIENAKANPHQSLDNISSKINKNRNTSSKKFNLEKSEMAEWQELNLKMVIEQKQNTITNLHEGLENLSDQIYDFLDEDDDDTVIDFFQ